MTHLQFGVGFRSHHAKSKVEDVEFKRAAELHVASDVSQFAKAFAQVSNVSSSMTSQLWRLGVRDRKKSISGKLMMTVSTSNSTVLQIGNSSIYLTTFCLFGSVNIIPPKQLMNRNNMPAHPYRHIGIAGSNSVC